MNRAIDRPRSLDFHSLNMEQHHRERTGCPLSSFIRPSTTANRFDMNRPGRIRCSSIDSYLADEIHLYLR
jgi:hypothetical protein